MKKILFAISAVALLFATSCNKENVNPAVDVPEGSFLATIDNGANPQNAPRVTDGMGTMTTIDGDNYVIWEDNDEISINGQTYITTKGEVTAVFSPKDQTKQASGTEYHAFYPATIAGTGAAGTLPEYQTGNVSNLPMYAHSTNNQLTFHNICAVLKITIPSFLDGAVFIKVLSDQYMNGTFTVDANNKAVMTETSPDDYKKWVLAGSLGQTFSENDVVYIAVPAQAYSNLKILFFDDEDDKMWEKTLATCTFEVNKIYNVKVTEVDNNLLPGLFSVSATQQVKFTKGNLTGSSTSTSFESTQLSLGGEYSWSTDWQSPVTVGGKEYRLLSKDEWGYLINSRTMSGTTPRYKFPVTIGSDFGFLVLFPDTYTGSVNDTYSSGDWQTAEAAGAVCFKNKQLISNKNTIRVAGHLWSSTQPSDGNAGAIIFEYSKNPKTGAVTLSSVRTEDQAVTNWRSIRLVKNY